MLMPVSGGHKGMLVEISDITEMYLKQTLVELGLAILDTEHSVAASAKPVPVQQPTEPVPSQQHQSSPKQTKPDPIQEQQLTSKTAY